jgi:hypothetical protein
MIKLLALLVAAILCTPFATSLIDGLCWFYTSATCTGLEYTMQRASIVFSAWFIGMLLVLTIVG